MNICIHVEYLVVMDMHFFHIMENHIIWKVKFSLVLKLPPNLHYKRRQTSPLLLSSATQSLDRLCPFIRFFLIGNKYELEFVLANRSKGQR